MKEKEGKDGKEGAEARFTVKTTGTKTPDVMAWRHIPRVLFAFDLPFFTTSLAGRGCTSSRSGW